MAKSTTAPQYSLVASNSDLNLRFDTDRFKLISTGSLGPVNGPVGSSSIAQWTLESLYWDQPEDVHPRLGIQKFENIEGQWFRKFSVNDDHSATFLTNWTQTGENPDTGGEGPADTDMYFSGRMRDLSEIDFFSLYGNGLVYSRAELQTTYAAGVPDLLVRTADTAVVGSTTSAITATDKCAWKLKCMPTHLVTIGRPRSQIIGTELDFYTPYRLELRIKLKHVSAMGWCDKATDMPLAALFALSQLTGAAPYDFSTGQLTAGSSPFYLILRGASLYPEIRGIVEELGLAPDDPGATVDYTKWDYGDTQRTSGNITPIRCLHGAKYHEIIIDFLLDERRTKDGGEGYFRGTFDGRPWFDMRGPTSSPRNDAGNLIPCLPRIGFYEVSGAAVADGSVNSTVHNSVTVERSIMISRFVFTRNPTQT